MKSSKAPTRRDARFSLAWDRVTVYAAAFLCFAIPLFILPGITEYGYGKSIVMLVAVAVLSVLWGLDAWQKGEWKIRLPWIAVPIAGLVVASLLSLVHATSGRVVLQSLALVLCFAQFALILANVVRGPRDVDLVLGAFLLSAFFAALYGLLQYLGVARGATPGGGLENVISFMGNRNYLGGFLTYLLYPFVILVLRPRSRVLRAAAIPLIAFSFGMTLLVQQTAVVVSMVLAGIAFLVGWLIFRPIEPLRARRAGLIALLLALLVTFLVEAPSGPLNAIVGLSADGSSWIGRLWEKNAGATRSWDWWVGWEMLKDHPITGVGLGNYKLNFIEYKAAFLATPRGQAFDFYIPRAAQAHNDYVQVLAETGILGALALVGVLVVLPISLWIRLRRNSDEWNRLDLLLLSCGLVTFLAHAFVSFPAHLPASSLVAVALAGLAFSPAYGTGAGFELRLRRTSSRVVFVGVVLVGMGVSILALRDVQANILMGRGIQQAQLGYNILAEETLERSLALDFCPRQTYYYLANVQGIQGRTQEAFDHLEQAIRLFADEAVYLTYADTAASLGRFDEARATVELLLASRPHREVKKKARYILAMVEAKEGNLDEAIRQLDELAADEPSYEMPHIALGNLFALRGMPVNARKELEIALQLIDTQLARSEEKLASSTVLPTAEYGTLRSTIERLRQQREAVLDKLAELP